MGVPDEIDGPVRKRPRLSLRASHRPDQRKSTSGAPIVEMTTENMTGTKQSSYALVKTLDLPSECVDLPADLPSSSDPLVAPVASLHNLGNTCFLNSMLEVLRYTPGFLDGLHRLQEDILVEEDKLDSKDSDTDSSEVRSAWQIVKNACAMFTEMDKREEQYKEIATADASSMAVRPSALLDNIRELNPMFEGHFQHDAQELLRCLLCYIEDAEKELTQLRDKERATVEDAERNSEAKPTVLITEESEKIGIGGTEKRTSANAFCSSLKGGENHDRGKIVENNRQRQHEHALDVSGKNILRCEKSTVDSVMMSCHKDNSANGSNTVDDDVTSVKLEGEEVEASFPGLSSFPVAKDRKRKRPMPKSGNRLIGALDDGAKTSTVSARGLRRKAAGSDSHTGSKSVGTNQEVGSAVTDSTGGKHSEKVLIDCYSNVDFHQNLQTKAAVSSHCAMSPGPSSAAASSETESTSSRILSVLPLSQIKRLGMRGRAMASSPSQTSEQRVHGDNNSSNNSGDVNNNNDNFISNNSSRSDSVAGDNNIHVDVLEHQDSNHQAMSPLCRDKRSPCKMVLSPAKSPGKVEHTDEISVIPDSDTSRVNSVNTVMKKYSSSVSRSRTANSIQKHPSLTCTEAGSGAEASYDVSPLHVLEPDKEINVTVQVSPKKKSSVLELNKKPQFCVPCDKPSNEMLVLSSEDTSKCPVPLGDTYPSGVQNNKDRDSVLWTWLNTTDVSAHGGTSQFPETLQTSDDLAASCTKVTSPCDILQRQGACANSYSFCDPQSKHNVLKPTDKSPKKSSLSFRDQDITAQRSPGANNPHNIGTLQPKLELRKCDWLGVSPVKSVSAREAMHILSEKSMGLGCLTARRKILYDDSESSTCSSCNISSVGNCIPTEQSHDMSSHKNHTEVIDSVSSHVGPAAAESESKQKRSKLSLSTPSRKSRTSQQAAISRKQIPCSSNKMLRKCQSLLPGRDISLKSLSVTLDRCDWLLQARPGLPVSAKQALVDIREGNRTVSQNQKHQSEMADFLKQYHVNKTHLPVSGIRPQASPGTLVERLFGGIMMHQTKCLECELARHRQEVFMDIGVPVRSLHNSNSDDDSDDDSSHNRNKSGSSCLSKLMQACTSVERLNDANKYFCDQCMHHVEAERSCHYLTLPSVLTLHLKRFSTDSKLFGHVSKLTDKVAIPQTLPCLNYQCKSQCSSPGHMFSLFAIVTHSGSSILHGHYRAYVKVQSHVNPSVFRNLLRSKIKTEEDQLVGTKIDTSSHPDQSSWTAKKHGSLSESAALFSSTARDDDDDVYICDETFNITASTRSLSSENEFLGNDFDEIRTPQSKSHSDVDRKSDLCPSGHIKSESMFDNDEYGSFWLECDDECIKVMEEHEFIEKLEEKDGCLIGTPYVLFYHKLRI